MRFQHFIKPLLKGLVFTSLCCQIHLDAVNPVLFQQKLREPTPQWMIEQIEKDLAPFKKELSRKFLDGLFTMAGEEFFLDEVVSRRKQLSLFEQLYLVRVRVTQGVLTIQASDTSKQTGWVHDIIIPRIKELHSIASLPDIDFVFTGRDYTALHEWRPCLPPDTPLLPIFVMSKCSHDKGLILFPDWFALDDGYEPAKSQILQGNKKCSWESKITLLLFRGADSGVWDRLNWRSYPRPKLVALSLKYPHLIDAKFSTLLDYDSTSEIRETIKSEGMMGNFVSMVDHPRYKYVMDVDGHCAAAPRLPLLLHSNSVLFKNMTSSRLWFYPSMKPYVHFVPVKEDLSDLITLLKWARFHDKECKKISQNAQELAAEVLSHESIYLYLYRLLCEYSKKQQEQYNLE
jgi:hypothetical protein